MSEHHAAIVGPGIHGRHAYRGPAPQRNRRDRLPGRHPRGNAERGHTLRPGAGLREPGTARRGLRRRRRARLHAQLSPFPARQGRAPGRQARHLREALAVTSAESSELVALARQQGRAAAVNYNLRFFPLAHEAHSRVHAGELGDVRLVHGRYLQDWLLYPTDWNWRLESDQGGTMRAVTDIGTHWFDMLTWITGLQITAVLADLATVIPTRYKPAGEIETYSNKLGSAEGVPVAITTDDYATILLRFENGARGVVTVSQVSAGHKNGLEWEINGAEIVTGLVAGRPEQPLAGLSQQAQRGPRQGPVPAGQRGARLCIVSRRPRGRLPGYLQTVLQGLLRLHRRGRLHAPAPFATFAEGHPEMSCATPSSAAPRRAAGWRLAKPDALLSVTSVPAPAGTVGAVFGQTQPVMGIGLSLGN